MLSDKHLRSIPQKIPVWKDEMLGQKDVVDTVDMKVEQKEVDGNFVCSWL